MSNSAGLHSALKKFVNDTLTSSENPETMNPQTQQMLLNTALHLGDMSTQTRSFDLALKWTYLVQEEFFRQGDIEKGQGIPVVQMFDREKLDVPKSQVFFINLFVTPLFGLVSQIVPELKEVLDNAEKNKNAWEQHSYKHPLVFK